MSTLKMPERKPEDGPIDVRITPPGEDTRILEGGISIAITTNGVTEELHISDFNAWRLFGLLGFLLKIPMPTSVQKAIKL